MTGSNRAAIGVIVLSAAGCLLPTGHVDLDAPPWCASAGPGAVLGDCESGAGGSFEPGSRSARAPARRPPALNASMTVTAYRHDGSVAARWRGPTRWVGSIPAAGMMFTGAVDRGRVTWEGASARDVRVATKRDGSGGLPLRRWLLDRAVDAMRVSVVVTRARGARGADAGGVYGIRTNAGADAAGGRGNASGDGRGRLRDGPRDGGDGSHLTGTRGGSPHGSGARPGWVDEPTAALSPRGGRVPKPGGAEGGSPAGTGNPGDHGLSVGMPVFGGVISVPASIAPALDVAAILAEAGASPAALASKWIRRGLRLGVRGLRREIGKEAAKHAERAVATTRRRLSRSTDFRRLSPAEQQRILDAMDDALRREYLARVEDGIAREIADIEKTLPQFRTPPRNEVTRHIAKRLRDRLEAAQRVKDATRHARADLGPAPTRASSSAASGRTPRFIATGGGVTIDRLAVNTSISAQRQSRHVLGARQYGGGSYFHSATDAQRVLDAFHSGAADVLGVKGNNIVVRVPSVTGYNVNPGAGFPNQATNVFFIKGTRSPSVVPHNPDWTP